MTPIELQAIKDRCDRNQGRNDGAIRRDIRDLLAEVERLTVENQRMKCCGNCRYFMRNPKTCAGCVMGSKWEVADNG